VNLLPGHQSLLQVGTDLDGLGRIAQLHGQRRVIQTRSGKLIRLLDKSHLKPTLEVGRHLARDATGMVVVDEVALGVRVDRDLPLRADDLGDVFLPVRHHAGAVVVGDPAAVELDDAHRVVEVVVPLQLGPDGPDAVGGDALGDDVVAEEPQRQVDVVHAHVDEDAAGPGRVLQVEAGRVQLVARLAADDRGSADQAPVDLVDGVAEGVVEAAREAAHHLQVRSLVGFLYYFFALLCRREGMICDVNVRCLISQSSPYR